MDKLFKSFFKSVEGNEGDRCRYNTRLDTYGCGCAHDCSYCYAKSLLEFRKLWNPKTPMPSDLHGIRRVIEKKLHKGDIVRLGGMTDCFQPIEKEKRVTMETIKMLNERGVEYLIVTKSDLVASEEYLEVMDKTLAHIQISVTTTDDELSKTYEHVVVSSRRIKAIEKLQSLGYDVSLRLSPFIPEYIDFDILNNVKCDKILVEFLRANSWIKRWFKGVDWNEYSVKSSNYNHLPLVKKIEHLERIKGFKEMSVCEDVPEHWEYWRMEVNHNPEDCCNLRRG